MIVQYAEYDQGKLSHVLRPMSQQQELFVVRLKEDGHIYHLICSSCGHVHRWDTGGAPFTEMEKGQTSEFWLFPGLSNKSPFTVRGLPDDSNTIAIRFPNLTSGLRQCIDAFRDNVSRLIDLGELTEKTAGLAAIEISTFAAKSDCRVKEFQMFKRTIGSDPDSPNMPEFIENYKKRARLEQNPLSRDTLSEIRGAGLNALSRWAHVHKDIALGVHAVLLSQIALSWTAFEMLSKDLWVAAVNERPNPLAINIAKSEQPKGQDKSIPITVLSNYGNYDFNLSAVMGKICVDQKKVDFTSLQSTRFAYDKAFGQQVTALARQDLAVLELVRNLILHRGGNVDQEFCDRRDTAGLSAHPDVATATPGKQIVISPESSARHILAGIYAGEDLIEFTCNFLWPNPQSPASAETAHE